MNACMHTCIHTYICGGLAATAATPATQGGRLKKYESPEDILQDFAKACCGDLLG